MKAEVEDGADSSDQWTEKREEGGGVGVKKKNKKRKGGGEHPAFGGSRVYVQNFFKRLIVIGNNC